MAYTIYRLPGEKAETPDCNEHFRPVCGTVNSRELDSSRNGVPELLTAVVCALINDWLG